MKDKAKEYTEKQYYKVDDIDEFNGEPLAVYRAYKQCQEDMAKDIEYWQGEFDHLYKDMADKKYTEKDIINAVIFGMRKGLNVGLEAETDCDWVNNYVNSLNKQD